MSVVAGVFLWTFYIAYGMEAGNEYVVEGSARSLASIILGLAALGTKKVILIFGALFAIAATSFIIKTAKPKTIQKIVVKRN